jgi:small-conductance mechanosensitive channel
MYQEEINKKHQQIHELRSYLKSTDYMNLRQDDEPEKVMSEEVKEMRINARNEINVLESEIVELEALEEEYLKTTNTHPNENY